jgi:hypothetical protein
MNAGSPSTRRWWLLAGGLVVAVALLTALEKLVGTPPTPSETRTTEEGAPQVPSVRRLDDGAVEIRDDPFHRTRIRLGSDAEEQALYDCLSSGFESAFGDGRADGLGRDKVRAETRRIRERCMEALAPPPAPAGQ